MSDPAPLFELPEELAIDTGVARRIIAVAFPLLTSVAP